ncbi:fungal-specific transcription factor domain-containing protein [Boletus edulis]|nr:fungal-specific transcription factor domain-containing protein [Boletus edulis]
MQPHPPPLEVKGQDPQSLDLSDTPAIAKCFGVHPLIVSESHLAAQDDREDLAIGSYDLSSGRDQNISGASPPRDPNSWFSIFVPTSVPGVQSPVVSKLTIWLPKDREMVNKVVDVYFTHLNIHRPVFFRSDFERRLNALYDMENVNYDPGFVCSMYIILALGTLSELNRKATLVDSGLKSPTDSPISTKNLLSSEWPEHYEFFERALAVKPQLHVTITSLQALILLQWYLYTERQGRSLWRLVGTLVRLSIELGLHHDPTSRNNTFTEEEAQLRIRLWGIVILHDRGTSIFLGRPLAIAPCDSNTPHPSRHLTGQPLDFSEHFLLSHPVAEIQADIINSLHAPSNKAADAVLRHATRIIKSLTEFQRQLPESYTYYFGGTEDWPLDKRQELVRGITEDQGLTLLKIGITKILLLRVLFRLKELDYMHRSKALDDAIVASHNIIIVHNQLIRYPHAPFFISPIPLHIAAMVILYGHMSRCERLSRQVMIEDVWMALDMLPRFRWRWERKDLNDGHPLISTLAEKVLNVDLRSVSPPKDPVLLSESDWETETVIVGSSSMSSPRQAHLPEIPTGLFYPFYPESQMGPITNAQASGANDDGNGSDENNGDHTQLLAAAAAQPDGSNGTYGHQSSQDSYMLKEIVPPSILANGHTGAIWMNVVSAPHIDRD